MKKIPDAAVAEIFGSLDLPPSCRDRFEEQLGFFLETFAEVNAVHNLPDRPLREYEPYVDSIIDYMQADDGFGPWFKVGLLTRPLIRRLSTPAYDALNNYLQRNGKLPDDFQLPTKKEIVARRDRSLGLVSQVVDQSRGRDGRARILRRIKNTSSDVNP